MGSFFVTDWTCTTVLSELVQSVSSFACPAFVVDVYMKRTGCPKQTLVRQDWGEFRLILFGDGRSIYGASWVFFRNLKTLTPTCDGIIRQVLARGCFGSDVKHKNETQETKGSKIGRQKRCSPNCPLINNVRPRTHCDNDAQALATSGARPTR